METAEPAAAPPEVHENILKGQAFARRYVSASTEAIIVIGRNGRYAMMDMQKPGAYQVRPDELCNERWREVLPRPAAMPKVLPNPVLPPVAPVVTAPAPLKPKKPIGRPPKLKNDQITTGEVSTGQQS